MCQRGQREAEGLQGWLQISRDISELTTDSNTNHNMQRVYCASRRAFKRSICPQQQLLPSVAPNNPPHLNEKQLEQETSQKEMVGVLSA